MTVATTCFRPTPNRHLHLGGVWNALQNWLLARATGGRFVVVVDDICYEYGHCWTSGYRARRMADSYLEDLEWFGIVPDRMEWSSANRDRHRWANERLGYSEPLAFANRVHWAHLRQPAYNPDDFADRPNRLRTTCEGDPLPLSPTLSLYYMSCCLVDDHDFEITAWVAGRDLLPAWAWIVDGYERLGFARPDFFFHPTLKRSAAGEKISKSAPVAPAPPEPSIRDLREAGYDPDRIIETLLECNVQQYIDGTEQIIIPLDVLTCEEVRCLPYRNRELEEMQDAMNWEPACPWMEDVAAQIGERLPDVTRIRIAEDHRAQRAN